VRIVFWGSERGCGVTSNMLILANYLACKKGYRISILELAEEKHGIQKCFPETGEYYVENYIQTLVKYQLYYISMDIWKAQKKESLVDLIKYLEWNMDMVFINLADCKDREAKNLMHNADLVVVNVRQEFRSFDDYFAHYANLCAKIFLLIGNYYEDGDCDRAHLLEKYAIPEEQLAVIPNNPEYEVACSRGRVDRYIRRNARRFVSNMKSQFLKEVEKTAELLCQAGTIKNRR